MKRLWVLCLMLGACTETQVVPPPAKSAQDVPVTTPTALAPVVGENPDSPMRYHLPIVEEPIPMRPIAVHEMRLHNGMRALLVTRTEVPAVFVNVVVRWRSPQVVHRTALAAVLVDGKSKNARSLRASLFEQGQTQVVSTSHAVASVVEFATVSTQLEASISAIFDSFSKPIVSLDNVDALRGLFRPSDDKALNVLRRHIEETYFPASHPFHVHAHMPEADQIDLQAASRFRDAELRPEDVTVCVTGNVSAANLESMLNRSIAGFKSSAAAPERKSSAAVAPVGTYLRESVVEHAGGAVIFPAPSLGDSDFVPYNLAVRILGQLMRQDDPQEAHQTDYDHRPFIDSGYLYFVTTGDAVRAAKYSSDVFENMKRVSAGEFTPSMLAAARRVTATVASERAETLRGITHLLFESVVYGGSPDLVVKIHNDVLTASADSVMAAAQKWFRRDNARIVATGDTAALKKAFATVDVRPVTVVTPKPDARKGKKK